MKRSDIMRVVYLCLVLVNSLVAICSEWRFWSRLSFLILPHEAARLPGGDIFPGSVYQAIHSCIDIMGWRSLHKILPVRNKNAVS